MPPKARSAYQRRRVDRFPPDILERKFRVRFGIPADKAPKETAIWESKFIGGRIPNLWVLRSILLELVGQI